ncbi:MAG: DNA-3-methyladenine glycosylase I [Rhizobiales bacterium]|nr:DNA-3-methyladenine glycosylase I [Hyphomicrobiales bacterium]
MIAFDKIQARAERRKGGAADLKALLPPIMTKAELSALPDDRMLAEMARRVFCAGFVWRVIDNKWRGFEEAFLGFQPKPLLFQPDEFWHDLARDPRIVKNPMKIKSVRENAAFVADIAAEHGSFGKFLAAWPADDQIGLMDLLGKRGARLGARTGQYFLRFIGFDGFVAGRDTVAALRDAGLDIAAEPTSKGDLKKIQGVFNDWARETGLPRVHLSRICAMSIGENYDAATLMRYGGGEE